MKSRYYKSLLIHWNDVYKEVATALSEFYLNHKDDSGRELYRLCIQDIDFVNKNKWVEKFSTTFNVESLDPIHIFTTFNAAGQSSEVRITKINLIFRILGIDKYYNDISFDGCPTPFQIKMVGARNEKIQKEIWDVFYSIYLRKHLGLNKRVFNKIPNWFGIDISSFTIFLFWIDSDNFLSLDKNTSEFLKAANVYKKKPYDYLSYKNLIPCQGTSMYREITKAAVGFKEKTEESKNVFSKLGDFFNVNTASNLNLGNFRIIGLRPVEGINKNICKVLLPGQIYSFYNCYEFNELNGIKYISERDIDIYSVKENDYRLDVHISAIVGKNGAGKSTLTELFYLAINNFSKSILKENCKLECREDVKVELYYHLHTVYKIFVNGGSIEIWEYTKQGNVFINPRLIVMNKEDLASFFYSIAVNYSHFSLNSNEIGDWIKSLFHKNDGYEVPIVINPMRTEGNININVENSLVISRLLSNILEPVSDNLNIQNLRQITENGRSAKSLLLSLAHKKFEYLYNKQPFPPNEILEKVINQVYSFFSLNIKNKNEITEIAKKYIYKKLVNMCLNYEDYRPYYNIDKGFGHTSIKPLLKRLNEDPSHKTFKFKQAINYLKFDHLRVFEINNLISVDQLSDNIQKVIENNLDLNLRTILLIPPSFFNVEIFLNDESSFNYLSSGEKQKIHITSSLIYHLQNLNSISPDSIKYSYINILFDEIELYFHPEMQRSFINFLLGSLRKVKFEDLYGINFCFATHSPFILSDIPSNNILFLDKSAKPLKDTDKLKTFGANIHDLLADSFFLDKGFIGKFAEGNINNVINWTLGQNSTIDSEHAKAIIEIIDDPIIKVKLLEMYAKKMGENLEVARLRAQQEIIIKRLNELGQND